MPRPEALLRHNLHEFQESVLTPLLDITAMASRSLEPALVDHGTASGLEAVWWAHLGSALEFFSVTEAAQVLREQWVFIVHNLDDFLRRHEQHFDSQLLTARDSFPDPPESTTMFTDPCCLRSVFQELLIKTSLANADPALRSFSAALNFTSRAQWDKLIAAGINSSAAPSAAPVTPTLSVVGVARALDFMTTVRRTAEITLTSTEIEEPDAYAFVRSVARIVRWRFSVHLPGIHERFVQVADRIFDMTQHALHVPSALNNGKDTYLQRVDGMLQDWQSWGGTADTLSP